MTGPKRALKGIIQAYPEKCTRKKDKYTVCACKNTLFVYSFLRFSHFGGYFGRSWLAGRPAGCCAAHHARARAYTYGPPMS